MDNLTCTVVKSEKVRLPVQYIWLLRVEFLSPCATQTTPACDIADLVTKGKLCKGKAGGRSTVRKLVRKQQ